MSFRVRESNVNNVTSINRVLTSYNSARQDQAYLNTPVLLEPANSRGVSNTGMNTSLPKEISFEKEKMIYDQNTRQWVIIRTNETTPTESSQLYSLNR